MKNIGNDVTAASAILLSSNLIIVIFFIVLYINVNFKIFFQYIFIYFYVVLILSRCLKLTSNIFKSNPQERKRIEKS